MAAEYDDFLDVYDSVVQNGEIASQNLEFYVGCYLSCPGLVCELGVGTGRIAIEAAIRGKNLIGIDASERMLTLCRDRAETAGVADRVTLVQADFREFTLPEPAGLISLPFHTITDITELSEKQRVIQRVYDQLGHGGRFILDYFVFDSELAARWDNVPHIEAEYTDLESGDERIFWACARYDLENQQIRTLGWTDELDANMNVVNRRYRRYESSWILADQMGEMLEEVGFEVEALMGDFEGGGVSAESGVNVWVAVKA